MSSKKMIPIANITEQRFVNLAQLFEIIIKKGWKIKLSKKIGISQNLISTWINRNNIPPKRLPGIEEESFPKKKWYNVSEPYPVPEESIGVPPHDYLRSPGAMSYSAPELSNANLVATANRPLSGYLKDVKEIFASEETNIIAALSANIVQFREMVRDRQEREIDRKNMIKMQQQIQNLTKQLKVEKNGNDSSNNPGDNAENE